MSDPEQAAWFEARQEGEKPRYWCVACAEQAVPSLADGAVCGSCGATQEEPFREGWDGSD